MYLQKFEVKNKTALVTGAGKGIGKASAIALAEAGADLIILSRTLTDLNKVKKQINKLKRKCTVFECDVSNAAEVKSVFKQINSLDILVNNAGIALPNDFLEVSYTDFQKVLNVNLTGSFLATQRAAKSMIVSGIEGAIVNMSSVNAQVAIPSIAAYCASKGGVMQLTKAAALALAPYNIRVNAVGPGSIDTDMMAAVNANPEAMAMVMSRTPLKRIGSPREIGDVVAFLASSKASYITGETIYVDGGRIGMNYTC